MTEKIEKTNPMSGLAKRVLTAVIGIPVLLAVILVGPTWLWSLIVLAAIGIGLTEFYGMTTNKDEVAIMAMGASMGVGLAAMMVFSSQPLYVVTACVTVVMVMFLTAVFAYSTMERAFHMAAVGVTGVFYVALLTSFMALIRRDPGDMGRYWLLLLLAVARYRSLTATALKCRTRVTLVLRITRPDRCGRSAVVRDYPGRTGHGSATAPRQIRLVTSLRFCSPQRRSRRILPALRLTMCTN